jgi:ribulose-phosphate 3-epimerase
MLKCSTSLWSADLTNLENEIKRIEPYSDRFHIDVADGQYVETLLFFPDLVRAMRPHTKKLFEIHLLTLNPLEWIDVFSEAGADIIVFCFDTAHDPLQVIQSIKDHGKQAGISLSLQDDLDVLDPFWGDLDLVTIVCTDMGIKGAGMDQSIPEKIQRARDIVDKNGLECEIQADGGIRRHTVPLIQQSGADSIVPGSLMFGEDPEEMTSWLASL